MNELQIFQNEDFGEIRVVEKDGQAYFCLADINRALEINNSSQAATRLKHDGVISNEVIDRLGRKQMANFISESNLYRLIFQSRKDNAERFTDWVADEVLPSIRQNGGYIANQENLSDAELLANAVLIAQNVIANKDKLIEQLKPKAEFFDAVADSKSAVAIGDVAKVLGIRGLGRNNLFEKLRDKKVLMLNNQPYQKYIDAGYFRVIEQKFTKPDGETVISFKTLVYQKGVDYIRKLVA